MDTDRKNWFYNLSHIICYSYGTDNNKLELFHILQFRILPIPNAIGCATSAVKMAYFPFFSFLPANNCYNTLTEHHRAKKVRLIHINHVAKRHYSIQ